MGSTKARPITTKFRPLNCQDFQSQWSRLSLRYGTDQKLLVVTTKPADRARILARMMKVANEMAVVESIMRKLGCALP